MYGKNYCPVSGTKWTTTWELKAIEIIVRKIFILKYYKSNYLLNFFYVLDMWNLNKRMCEKFNNIFELNSYQTWRKTW